MQICLAAIFIVWSSVAAFEVPGSGGQQHQKSQCQQTVGHYAIPACIAAIQQPEIQPQAQSAKGEPSYWEKVIGPQTWSNWAVVFVAIWAGHIARRSWLVLREQTRATAKSAKATARSAAAALKSIQLQELHFRQWVEIDEWRNATPYMEPNVKRQMIRIGFKVGNATDYPLTLKRVTTHALGEISSSAPNRLIPPKEAFVFDGDFGVTIPQMGLYWKDKLTFQVAIDVFYEDVLERERGPQHFIYIATCGKTGITVYEQHNQESKKKQ